MTEPRTLAVGEADGEALVLDEPLSFWGGLDSETGLVIDAHHPQRGASLTERVVVMPTGRGSSSGSYVFAEAIRAGTAPAAVVLAEADLIVALGSLVAAELYDVAVPVVVVDADTYAALRSGERVRIDAHGDGPPVVTAVG